MQDKQLGTGHAVACAKEKLKIFKGNILVLYGDMPLVTETTIKKIFLSHQKKNAKLTMATAKITDFADWRESLFSFGRIIRNEENEIIDIREKVDCASDELTITEVNPSFFCFDSRWLWQNIDKLKTDNKQKEFYLTDLVKIAFDQKIKINSVEIDPVECLGVNTREQLEVVEKILLDRRMKKEAPLKFK
jgi:bifunctional UDP-N-acetylglucosamine pyrophosphorylase/glucosamine-1-phosphate N-acetyltransferase